MSSAGQTMAASLVGREEGLFVSKEAGATEFGEHQDLHAFVSV